MSLIRRSAWAGAASVHRFAQGVGNRIIVVLGLLQQRHDAEQVALADDAGVLGLGGLTSRRHCMSTRRPISSAAELRFSLVLVA